MKSNDVIAKKQKQVAFIQNHDKEIIEPGNEPCLNRHAWFYANDLGSCH